MQHGLKSRHHQSTIALLVCGFFIYFVNLGQQALRTWDEGVYANLARRILSSGDWLITFWRPIGEGVTPYLEKPPLGIWLEAASMKAFGIHEVAARLPSAICAVLLGLLAYRIACKLYDQTAGFLAGIILLTTAYLFEGTNAGTQGGVDVPFVLFGTLLVVFVWQSRSWRDIAVAAVAGGLAAMTKGVGAGVFLVIIAPLFLTRRHHLYQVKSVISIGAALLLTALWPIYAYVNHSSEFLDQMWRNQVVERVEGGLATREGTLFDFMHYPYFNDFPVHFAPWSLLLIPAVVVGIYHWRQRGKASPEPFLIWWFVSTYLFFALVRGNHGWYILPAIFPQALLVGNMVRGTLSLNYADMMGCGVGYIGLAVWRLKEGDWCTPVALGLLLAGLVCFGKWGDVIARKTPLVPTQRNIALLPCGSLVFAALLVAGAPPMPLPESDRAPPHMPQEAGALAGDYIRMHTDPDDNIQFAPRLTRERHLRTLRFHAQRSITRTSQAGEFPIIVTQYHVPDRYAEEGRVIPFTDGTWTYYVIRRNVSN